MEGQYQAPEGTAEDFLGAQPHLCQPFALHMCLDPLQPV